MTKRIFKSICVVAITVLLASIAIFMGVLYEYFTNIQRRQLQMQTELASAGVAGEGLAYFEDLDIQDYRITWIDTDGTVLYDSRSDSAEMGNHLERQEIRQALAEGTGESTRYSDTLLERSLYCAKRLRDGTVVRLSIAQHTLLTLIITMIQPICVIFALAAILAFVLADRLAKRIVNPLNGLNLDEPLSNDDYDELSPLLHRIDRQQKQIKRQERELLQKRIEFETVTMSMTEGLVLLNQKGIILSINQAAMHLLETTRNCAGKDILSVNRSIPMQELLEKAIGGTYAETVMELAGGRYQLDASPVSSDGRVYGIVLLFLDVTEKEKAEQMRREFTANVSHELKTPLHTISGCAELMTNGMVKAEDIPRFSGQIYAEAQRMIRLVEDIIKLSHLDETVIDLNQEDVELYELAKKTVESLTVEAKDAQVTVSLEGEPVHVYGMPQLLQSIIYNLCDNAIKYNRKGGSVTVRTEAQGEQAVLTVSDTGIGIPKDHQGRIFERFFRVDKSHSKEIGGTGLGLSIVKHAAKAHGADIEVKSEPGGGTTISVVFQTNL